MLNKTKSHCCRAYTDMKGDREETNKYILQLLMIERCESRQGK